MSTVKRNKLIESLDDLMRLANDIRIALNFKDKLEESNGVADLLRFGSGESIFTKLSTNDLMAIDVKIAKFVNEFKARASELKYEP